MRKSNSYFMYIKILNHFECLLVPENIKKDDY